MTNLTGHPAVILPISFHGGDAPIPSPQDHGDDDARAFDKRSMHEYLADRLVRIGLGILIVGSVPLLGIILLAEIGVWPDPNPNPIGPGLLFFFSFWPGVFTLGLGIWRVNARRHSPRDH